MKYIGNKGKWIYRPVSNKGNWANRATWKFRVNGCLKRWAWPMGTFWYNTQILMLYYYIIYSVTDSQNYSAWKLISFLSVNCHVLFHNVSVSEIKGHSRRRSDLIHPAKHQPIRTERGRVENKHVRQRVTAVLRRWLAGFFPPSLTNSHCVSKSQTVLSVRSANAGAFAKTQSLFTTYLHNLCLFLFSWG